MLGPLEVQTERGWTGISAPKWRTVLAVLLLNPGQVVSTDRHEVLDSYTRSEDFFEAMAVMPDSQRVMHRLQMSYEVFIATAAMEIPSSFQQKYRWLAKHFPFIPASNIVYCGDKSILRADYLIDDNPRQLRRFTGEGILYSSPHNLGVQGYKRVNDWLEVEELFLG